MEKRRPGETISGVLQRYTDEALKSPSGGPFCCNTWQSLRGKSGIGKRIAAVAKRQLGASSRQLDVIETWPPNQLYLLAEVMAHAICPRPGPKLQVKFRGTTRPQGHRSITVSLSEDDVLRITFTAPEIVKPEAAGSMKA